MKMPRIIRRRRAVSPVLAAILLIGLAVAAAAVLFVVVLPMIAGNADVRFVSAVAADQNSDGLLDKITVQVQNKGSATDTFADGTITPSGWSAAGNIEITSANPIDLVFKTTDIYSQIEETASLTITLSFETSADITITETDIDMDHAVTLTDSDMLIDFTDGYWHEEMRDDTTATGNDVASGSISDTEATHSGKKGAEIDHNAAGDDDVIYFRKMTVATDEWQDAQNTKAESPEEWDTASFPVLSFWLKIEVGTPPAAGGTNPDIYLILCTYDGETEDDEDFNAAQNEMEDIQTGLVSTTLRQWHRVMIDFSTVTGNNWSSTVVGSFGIRIISATDMDVAIDDVSIHEGLA